MKIVIAPDSFKECLGAARVAAAIGRGWAEVFPAAQIFLRPMADGGDGTVEAVLAACAGERRTAMVRGPLGEPVRAEWALLADGTAVLEMAAASGLHRVSPAERDVGRASSFGTGQLIAAALDAGAGRIVLGLGGSASNDGGAGMLQALGADLRNAQGQTLAPGGLALATLASIDLSGLDPRLTRVPLEVAADVDNPLCGERGASAVFGPQKGASADQVQTLDAALGHWARRLAALLGVDHSTQPGAGAAGGLGFAACAVLGAPFRAGVQTLAELCDLRGALCGADLAITGEGRLDGQTLHGKAPAGVAGIARELGVPTIALAGSLGTGYQSLYQTGIEAAFALVPGPMSLDQAMADAEVELQARTVDIARLWRLALGDRQ